MKYIGQPIPMYDSLAKVCGEAVYTDDLVFPNMLHGMILTSPHAHARIVRIDTSKAEALAGVHAVVCYKDAPETLYCRNMRRIHDPGPARERVFNQTVRYVGDKVAAVAADTEAIARRALRLIDVEYEVLPAVFDPEEAAQPDAYPMYEDGNLVSNTTREGGDVDAALAAADHVVEHYTQTAMIHHGAIEPHLCVAHWSRAGELSVWEPQRAPYRAQMMLGKIFGVPYSKVHVHGQIIGGTFGSKESMIIQPVALMLSRKTGRHVKIRYSRKECITSTFTRHAMKMRVRLGVNNDGTITAIDMKAYQWVGAYAGDSLTVLFAQMGKFFKLYAVPNIRFRGIAAYTNTPLGGAMRGYGSPNVFFALESAVSHAARTLEMDEVALREKNLMKPYGKAPDDGENLYNGQVRACLQKGVEKFRWYEKQQEAKAESDARYAYGVGLATTLHGNGVSPGATDIAVVSIELGEDGTVMLHTGISDHGAGTYTLYHQLVAEILDMPLDHIALTHADTTNGHYDKGAGSSRNTWVGGAAVCKVARLLLDDMLQTAAEKMGVEKEDVRLEDEHFVSETNGQCLSKIDVAEYACEKQHRKLIKVVSHNSPHNAGSYGAHFARVRVDRQTGEVQVLEYLAVCDVGRVLNPILLNGQIEGSIMMGMGMALYEEVLLDEKGAVTNGSFKKYRIAKMKDLPDIRIEYVEASEPDGPFEGKSIGEAAIVPVAPAIVGAVNNALGTNLSVLPLTPDKILEVISTTEDVEADTGSVEK